MPRHLGFLAPVGALLPHRKQLVANCQTPVMTTGPSRRAFVSLACSTLLLALPDSSHALSRQEAEQEARLAYASLPQLSAFIDLKDYNGFRQQLRIGAMSRVRVSCTAWYQSFEPTDGRAVAGQKSYRGLIKAVEAADVAALKAERGADGDGVAELVRCIAVRFDEFLGVVGE